MNILIPWRLCIPYQSGPQVKGKVKGGVRGSKVDQFSAGKAGGSKGGKSTTPANRARAGKRPAVAARKAAAKVWQECQHVGQLPLCTCNNVYVWIALIHLIHNGIIRACIGSRWM